MDRDARIVAAFLLVPVLAFGATVYHIQVQGSTQLTCKITHKATRAERYLLMTCEYRCDNPVGASVDAKTQVENIYCRGQQAATPATQGEIIEPETDERE